MPCYKFENFIQIFKFFRKFGIILIKIFNFKAYLQVSKFYSNILIFFYRKFGNNLIKILNSNA